MDNEKTLEYLAVPYSHQDEAVRRRRFEIVNHVAAKLMEEGRHIFSPISHTHPIALAGKLPLGWEFWRAYDYAMLRACKRLIILRLPGWQESNGVAGEIEIAKELGLEIVWLDYDEVTDTLEFWVKPSVLITQDLTPIPADFQHSPEAAIPTPSDDTLRSSP